LRPDNTSTPEVVDVGWLSPKEASRYLSVSLNALERMRRVGGGPPFAKLGRRTVRYRVPDLDAWMASRVVANTAEAAERGLSS